MNEKIQPKRLIKLAANGDSEAIQRIVEEHKAMVYCTCLRILGNAADAEDAAQATFVLFLKKCRKLKRGTILSGWLHRTARFVSREFIRKSARRKLREETAGIMQEVENQESEQVWSDLKPELDDALSSLSNRHREVVVLRYLDGKTTDEAALELGMTPSAVSTCLARALEKLRGRFKRRGIVVPTVVLSTVIAENASMAAVPAALGSTIVAKTATGGAAITAASANVSLMADGALAKMAWIKAKVVALFGVVATSGALLGLHNLQLNSKQIDALDFTEEQTVRANAIMAAHRADYVAIEANHTADIRNEENLVELEIGAFPDELSALKESFWKAFDEVCDERQRRVARRYLVLENLFPFGEYPVKVRLAYDGKHFSAREIVTHPQAGSLTQSESWSNLDPRWKRFWGDRKDASKRVVDMVFGRGSMVLAAGDEALTFEGKQPRLSTGFVETLNLDPQQLAGVNEILQAMRGEYLAVERQIIGETEITTEDDGSTHMVIPKFRGKRKALEKMLWRSLGDILDDRQLRLAKATKGLSKYESALFDWGNATCTIVIQKTAVGEAAENLGYQYKINIHRDGGMFGPSGSSSEAVTELPEKFRRFLER